MTNHEPQTVASTRTDDMLVNGGYMGNGQRRPATSLTQTREVVSALLHGVHYTPSCSTPVQCNPCPAIPHPPPLSIRPRAPIRVILTFTRLPALASMPLLAYLLSPVRPFAHLLSPVCTFAHLLSPVRTFAHLLSPMPPRSPCSYTAPLVTSKLFVHSNDHCHPPSRRLTPRNT
ncbi:hypothetical protein BD779DRAFT_1601920 [Infundibulicybe gibba]|nr:hypothetical protein BD779DRAFT_1601920 [Infundibulicybe gibba]